MKLGPNDQDFIELKNPNSSGGDTSHDVCMVGIMRQPLQLPRTLPSLPSAPSLICPPGPAWAGRGRGLPGAAGPGLQRSGAAVHWAGAVGFRWRAGEWSTAWPSPESIQP